jgi:hypothetical protein
MLNIAGPEYDFGNVVYVTIQECEHRRRGFDDGELEDELMDVARAKLAHIKAAYDEFGGSAGYWAQLEKEVLDTAMPQYIAAAREMNEQERTAFGIWRRGDPLARFLFALLGIFIALFLLAVPFLRAFELMFAVTFAAAGALYPEIKRFTHERRHYRTLNRLVTDAAAYQQNARLHYMTSKEIRESFTLGPPSSETPAETRTTTDEQ